MNFLNHKLPAERIQQRKDHSVFLLFLILYCLSILFLTLKPQLLATLWNSMAEV